MVVTLFHLPGVGCTFVQKPNKKIALKRSAHPLLHKA
jgi:hypothetical protein